MATGKDLTSFCRVSWATAGQEVFATLADPDIQLGKLSPIWEQFSSLLSRLCQILGLHLVVRAEPRPYRETCELRTLRMQQSRTSKGGCSGSRRHTMRSTSINKSHGLERTGIWPRCCGLAKRFSEAHIKIEIGRHSKDPKSPDRLIACHQCRNGQSHHFGLAVGRCRHFAARLVLG